MAGLMLECILCSGRKWLQLTPEQADDVRVSGATRLACDMCGRETFWKFSESGRRTGMDRRMDSEDSRRTLEGPSDIQRFAFRPAPEKDARGQTAAETARKECRSNEDRRKLPQRQNYRVPLQLPVRVRSNNGVRSLEEITTTINACRNGVYFGSQYPHSKGDLVYVTTNYSSTHSECNMEQVATVVRVEKPEHPSKPWGVAVQFS